MTETDARKRGRIKMLLIAAFCAAPMVLGWIAYLFDLAPGATANHGELLKPQPLTGAAFESMRGKWVLVSFDHAACDTACEMKLYYMRQVRKAQGKEQDRVARLWVLQDSGVPKGELVQAIAGTQIVHARAAGDPGQFDSPVNISAYIYLVDPLGNLMMRYSRSSEPAGMIQDIQRLLKYSAFG
jgi:cytochrome oxidase Cu insertion factor (SCO1/SenC/PrrC family)